MSQEKEAMDESGSGHQARAPLSRKRVLLAALDLADKGGVESLTMRALAQELGVEAMSIYYHVASKEEIIAGIIDLVATEIDGGPAGPDWRDSIRRRAISAHRAFVSHPWVSTMWMGGPGPGPARLRYMESFLGALRRSGFSAEMTHHAFHVLENHIVGYTMQSANFPFDGDELTDLAERFLEQLPDAEYPFLVEHVGEHLKEHEPADEGDFEFGLDLILDGLERFRERG